MRWREHAIRVAACLAAVPLWQPAWGQGARLGALEIAGGWVTATDKPGNALGYFVVHNRGGDDWLVGTSCAGAYGTTMNEAHPHQAFLMGLQPMSTDLRPVLVKVKVPANADLVFKPGGNFLMLQDVRWALQAGRLVNCTFVFELAGPVATQLAIVAAASSPPRP